MVPPMTKIADRIDPIDLAQKFSDLVPKDELEAASAAAELRVDSSEVTYRLVEDNLELAEHRWALRWAFLSICGGALARDRPREAFGLLRRLARGVARHPEAQGAFLLQLGITSVLAAGLNEPDAVGARALLERTKTLLASLTARAPLILV